MNETIKKVEEIDLNDILPNRFQPRIKFNEEKIFELSQSIKEHGVLQPIIVRPIGDKYEIVTGERRYKASVLAGLKTIPSIILKIEDKDSVELALIENVQREDLSPIEEAISYKKILDMGYLTQEELADKLGISQSAIANKKRLLNLCDEVQEALLEKEISERHARSLLKVTNHSVQKDLLYKIISEKLTVRQLDVEITKVLEDPNYVGEEIVSEENNEELQVVSSNENNNLDSVEENVTEKLDETSVEVEKSTEDTDIVANTSVNDATEEKENINESNINFDELLTNITSFKDDTSKTKDETSESININSIELEEDNNSNDAGVSVVEEKDENGENDTMNNMMNLDEEYNYNSLKNSSNPSGGKFIGVSVDDDSEEKVEQKPVIENKSFFDFSSGTVRDDANNNVTITRNVDYDNQNDNADNNNIFGKKMADLLSPQGSTDLIESDNNNSQNAIFSSTTEQKPEFADLNNNASTNEEQSSIFANLMKSEDSSSSSIDNDSLQSFLDPSFINGTKEETPVNSDSQINDSIFSKFIDEDFGGEVSTSVPDDSNDLLASTLFGNDKTEGEESVANATNLPELSNDVPSILETPAETVDTTPSIFEQTPSIKVDSDKIDFEDLSNSTSQTELISGLMASSKKPDLLAPMNGENKSVEENTTSSLFGLNTEDTSVENKPEENVENVVETLPQSSPSVDVMSENNDLTPDTTIETEVEPEDTTSIAETSEKPVFITASNEDINLNAPSTPIITDTKMSNLLSVEKTEENDNDDDETEGGKASEQTENVEEKENVEETTEEPTPITNQNIDIQPIIITDYNKQYDPVLPQIDVPKGPQIEFKHILGMIRDLNNKIEDLGYKIDTDEIDLDNTYQVIFNIEKK